MKSLAHPRTHVRVGIATYYCCTRHHPSGYYAAAGPALRVGQWRGRVVRVNGIQVTLIDWCQCYAGTDHERVIDLYPSVFSRIASLSRGIVKVTVSW